MSPRTGRPKSENPKNERIYIRVTAEEKAEIQDVCKTYNISLLELIRKGIEAITK